MQALVEHFVSLGAPEQVERCVLKMDILSLDLNQARLAAGGLCAREDRGCLCILGSVHGALGLQCWLVSKQRGQES